jgi:NADH-quinone oxidoreductase subunit M
MTFLPLVGALLIFFLPRASRALPRTVALAATAGSFLLSVVMLLGFDRNAPFQADQAGAPGRKRSSGPRASASPTSWASTASPCPDPADDPADPDRGRLVLGHGPVQGEPRRSGFVAGSDSARVLIALLLETGMLGVFMALDLFVFYIFWELMLIPMALLIGIWGSPTGSTRPSSSSSTRSSARS